MVYQLKKPFDFAGKPVTELEFREDVTGRDLKGLPSIPKQWQGEHVTLLASRLSNQPLTKLELVSAEDHFAIFGVISGFMFSSPAAGNGPSAS